MLRLPSLLRPFVGSLACGVALLSLGIAAFAQVNGAGDKPYLGWSSFSQQTIASGFLTQANMQAQSDAMASAGLTAHGYQYINMDSGWMGGYDAYGRPVPNTTTFPNIKALADHVHSNGQKLGIYWITGVQQGDAQANYPILGTPNHLQDILAQPLTAGNAFGFYKIDFTKPGAQEYMDSVVALFASWGIDFIKIDGVTPGSYNDNLSIDNRLDVEAWSKAIAKTGRPIWFTISWALDSDYLPVWQKWANARRIEDDVECEGNCGTTTDWSRIYQRFRELSAWQFAAGPTVGWNDLDSLDVINGAQDGLSDDEKQTAYSIWAMANAPLSLGGDLSKLDDTGKRLATNDEVNAVQQTGKPAIQVLGGDTQVWSIHNDDGSYYVSVSNMLSVPVKISVPWTLLGFRNATAVRDLWSHLDLGAELQELTTTVVGHGTRMFKVSAVGNAPTLEGTSYEAEAATLGGSASAGSCDACSGGAKVGNYGLSATNVVTFNNVQAPRDGNYYMQINSMTQGLRSVLYSVNGGLPRTLDSGGGSFDQPATATVIVHLEHGTNSIEFLNPYSYPPDLDRIVIRGNGTAPDVTTQTYEAELATLSGGTSPTFSNYSSGLAKAGNVGGLGTVTFPNVTVLQDGIYQLEIDYQTQGVRSLFVGVNGGTQTELDLNGTTFSQPATTSIPVQLNAGVNTIVLNNPNGPAPDIDRIVVAPTLASASLGGQLTGKVAFGGQQLWLFRVNNTGLGTAADARLNSVTFLQTAGKPCTPKVELPLPLPLGNIAPGSSRSLLLPISFARCSVGAHFMTAVTYSADEGAEVGTTSGTDQR
ncbi:alpha-galactosidase D [Granulicella arctica]|uniref:alpha-galactosidase D n=1 Tax=Granulicella arctica TaxID=940613 RepID=UPI0021E046B6|nr:CBM35 domain-containing protein [Granulicella arctica]